MKDHSGCLRCYCLLDSTNELMVGMYHPEGGTSGEFKFSWVDLGRYGMTPRLESFNDSWHALITEFEDLLKLMASLDGMNITIDEFCNMLEELDIKDLKCIRKKNNT